MARLDVRLTPEGRRELEQDLRRLEAERPVVAARLSEARANGSDPTENLDLRDAMDALALLSGRLGELRALLAAAEPIEETMAADGRARLGAHVRVRHTDGEEVEYTLVSPAEADPRKHRISVESPIGQVLVGSKKGESVTAETPNGSTEIAVLNVK